MTETKKNTTKRSPRYNATIQSNAKGRILQYLEETQSARERLAKRLKITPAELAHFLKPESEIPSSVIAKFNKINNKRRERARARAKREAIKKAVATAPTPQKEEIQEGLPLFPVVSQKGNDGDIDAAFIRLLEALKASGKPFFCCVQQQDTRTGFIRERHATDSDSVPFELSKIISIGLKLNSPREICKLIVSQAFSDYVASTGSYALKNHLNMR